MKPFISRGFLSALLHAKGCGHVTTFAIRAETPAVGIEVAGSAVHFLKFVFEVHMALIALGVLAAYEAIVPLPMAFGYLGQTVTSAKRINEVVRLAPTVEFPEVTKQMPQDASIHLDKLAFQYASTLPWVLRDFTLPMVPS